jgi:PAS domain-containing protein
MKKPNFIGRNESTNAKRSRPGDFESMFDLLFERTADAIWLFDPATAIIVDCNQATVALMRAKSRADLAGMRCADFSPSVQPDGSPTKEAA